MYTHGVINPQKQPVIGSDISLRETTLAQANYGKLSRPFSGGLLETAVRFDRMPWTVAMRNEKPNPFSPNLFAPVFLRGGSNFPREFPVGFESLSISTLLARPGEALAVKARTIPDLDVHISLDGDSWIISQKAQRLIGLGATGAFYGEGAPEFVIQVEQNPIWSQPWLFKDKDWNYDRVTFPDSIESDREAIKQERERLQTLWQQSTPQPLWSSNFKWPLEEFVEVSSHYGARRSVNNGPFDTYHEGTDLSAYRGTTVYAPAGGSVVLAEPLRIRGGAVILDHGFGIHTGYYHLSQIAVGLGDRVKAGDKLGEVGSTGRSTGNHLHWELLIGTTWVDAEAWMESSLAQWIRKGWITPIIKTNNHEIPPNHR
jgi:murein DD-endopeptidase MepM/ murein hydrolase activator NlpD